LKKKPSGHVLSVHIPENNDAVQAAVVRSPCHSVRKIASSLGLGRRSMQRILHNLQFRPYKLQIVQELKPNDSVLHLQFCENLFAKIKEDANCEMDST
jgi:hypothetical protein